MLLTSLNFYAYFCLCLVLVLKYYCYLHFKTTKQITTIENESQMFLISLEKIAYPGYVNCFLLCLTLYLRVII